MRNSAGSPGEAPACVGQCQDNRRQCVPSHGELGKVSHLQAEASTTASRPAGCVFMVSEVAAVAAITVRGSSVAVPKLVLGAYCLVELFLANSCQGPKQPPPSLVILIQGSAWGLGTAILDLCVVS